MNTAEIAYTETVAAGRPLQPAFEPLEYNLTIQVKAMTFTNEWIIPIGATSNRIGEGGGRFLQFPAFEECFEAATILPGVSCTDRIRLFRAKEPLENVNVLYDVTALEVAVGRVTLER